MVPRFYKRPWIIVAVCAAVTVFFGVQLPNLKIENDIREYLPHKDASYARLTSTEDQFGSMYLIGVSLETDAPSILTPENISVVGNITARVENLDNVDGVDSLSNIDYVCSQDGSLVATALVDDSLFETDADGRLKFVGSEADIAEINRKLIGWDEMYDRVMISDDRRATQMQITLLGKTVDADGNEVKVSNDDRMAVLHSVKAIVAEETAGTNLRTTVYGDPVISDEARTFMLSDLVRLIPLVVLVVIVCLFCSFTTLDGTLLPLLTVLMSTVWSCGLMALFGVQFTIVSSVIPVALIAVGSAYGIHVLTHYYIALEKLPQPVTRQAHAEAIWASVKEVFQAVMLAGVTTVVGFISLVSSPIAPLHSFAVFTSLGVAFSLILAVVFIPAMLMLKPLGKIGKKSKRMEALIAKVKAKTAAKLEKIGGDRGPQEDDEEESTYYKIYRFFTGTRARLVLFCAVIVALSVTGLRRLVIDTALINYFPADCKLRRDVDYVNARFAGTNAVYLLAEGDETHTMTNPEILKPLEDLQEALAAEYPEIGKVVSFTTFVKRMNQVMNGPDSQTAAAGEGGGASGADSSGGGFADFDDGFGDFDDGFGDFDDFDDGFGGFDDGFGESASDGGDAPARDADFVHPNVEYSRQLAEPLTVEYGLRLLRDAYDEAGGKSATVEDVVECLERRFNYEGVSYYEIPYDVRKYPAASRAELSDLVSQYLMLLGGDTLERFAVPKGSFAPTKLRVQLQLRSHSTDLVGKIIRYSEDYAAKYFPEGYRIEFTGAGEMEYVMTNMVVSSQLTSLLISLLSVFVIITISFRSGWAGLLGAIPLAFTIILNYMVMGFAHIKLDLVTSIIASVAIGVGIDYTIHFLETFRAERRRCDDMEIVLKRTFNKSGRGIVTNAVAVGFGFLVLCLSEFVVLRYIGILVAIVMFASATLAMTVIPGILNLTDPAFMKRPADKKPAGGEK